MMNLIFCGIPDENYFTWRAETLGLLKVNGIKFNFQELTALSELMKRGITKLPCILVGNRITQLEEIICLYHESI